MLFLYLEEGIDSGQFVDHPWLGSMVSVFPLATTALRIYKRASGSAEERRRAQESVPDLLRGASSALLAPIALCQ